MSTNPLIALILRVFAGLFGASLCMSGVGCWAPHAPETSVSVNPLTHTITFLDTKDNHVVVKGAHYNGATHDFALDELTIENSASSVIAMQIQQMQAWNQQMQTANEGLRDLYGALTQAAGMIAPGLNARLTPRVGPLTEIGKGVGAGLEQRIGGGAPASQPSK